MAQGRIILKSLGSSRKFNALADCAGKMAEFCQALYPMLIANSDDFGRQHGDAYTVKRAVWPGSPRSDVDFDVALNHMHKVGLLVRYPADDGELYIQVLKFEGGQPGLRLDRRTRSHFPDPPENPKDCSLRGKPEIAKDSASLPSLPGNSGSAPALCGKGREEKVREGKGHPPSPRQLFDLWNGTVEHLPKATVLSAGREHRARARLSEEPSLEVWGEVIRRMDASAFCQGKHNQPGKYANWIADFDTLLAQDTRARVLEGKWDDRAEAKPPADRWAQPCKHTPPCATERDCVLKRRADLATEQQAAQEDARRRVAERQAAVGGRHD